MRINRIKITDFRNFADFDIQLNSKNIVIVGENNAGKSNLIYALRLVLDTSLPNSARYLEASDFWDGLEKPFAGNEIHVTVEFADFDRDENELASVRDCFKEGDIGLLSAISFIYRPTIGKDVEDPTTLTKDDYEFYYCCDNDIERRITDLSFQKFIPMVVFPALRDASADIDSWRRSPLRSLIERLQVNEAELKDLGERIDAITNELLEQPAISALQGKIDNRLEQMVGETLTVDPMLGLIDTDPHRLLRFLRLFAEGTRKRPLGEIGTGYANILYLILVLLDAQQKRDAVEQATMLLAIEEPEAHLHPHLQRLVFGDLFNNPEVFSSEQSETEMFREAPPVLITTHSPHITSVAPLNSVLVLKRTTTGTLARNIISAKLSTNDVKDIERYLDVTRSELVFSKAVILVEGIVEAILISEFAKQKDKPLDEHGISIVNINGTDFVPYLKLLGPDGFDMQVVVITDGDPYLEDSEVVYAGLARGRNLFELIYQNRAEIVRFDWPYEIVRKALAAEGIFIGEHTIEVDLVTAGYCAEYLWTFKELGEGRQSIRNTKEVMKEWVTLGFEERETKIVKKIKRVCGKGRFAQRLSSRINPNMIPPYIEQALKYVGIE